MSAIGNEPLTRETKTTASDVRDSQSPSLGSGKRQHTSKIEKYCRWVCKFLRQRKCVRKSEFVSKFKKGSVTDAALSTDWNRIFHAIEIALREAGITIERSEDSLTLVGSFDPTRYDTDHFRTTADFAKKERMGRLVAHYLKRMNDSNERLSVFLGSGSTVFHVGQKMGEIAKTKGQYDQLFWTVNVALAAAWCELENPPVAKISIPEAVLETKSFRFATMQKPAWYAAIVVVGADGCLLEDGTDNVIFYANEVSVASNTNVFVNSATHSVICCLASSKMQRPTGEGQNAGPPITFPKKANLKRFLVTDKMPDERILKNLTKDGWVIITKDSDWPALVPSKLSRRSMARRRIR